MTRGRTAARGSAAVDFVLVGGLVTVLLVAVLQLGLALHVRTVLTDAAAEGARLAARADRGPADGVHRTQELISGALAEGYAQDVDAQYLTRDGLATVRVTVSAPLPVIGLIGPSGRTSVSAHALVEEP